MKSILYISKALKPFTGQELNKLSSLATEKNSTQEITGYLYYNQQRFLQYIEGNASAIDALIHKIKADPRHSLIMAIEDYSLDERRFPNWGMKSIADVMFKNSVVETTIIKTLTLFGDNNLELNPSSKSQLFRLMDELSVSIQS